MKEQIALMNHEKHAWQWREQQLKNKIEQLQKTCMKWEQQHQDSIRKMQNVMQPDMQRATDLLKQALAYDAGDTTIKPTVMKTKTKTTAMRSLPSWQQTPQQLVQRAQKRSHHLSVQRSVTLHMLTSLQKQKIMFKPKLKSDEKKASSVQFQSQMSDLEKALQKVKNMNAQIQRRLSVKR